MAQMRNNWQDVHGILLLNKPKGISSNQALQKVRRLLNAKKAGHTGSLDPMATGLLPCCFGDATKVAGLMLNADKIYIAQCQIGSQTDTGDATGLETLSGNKTSLTTDEIQQAIKQLTGNIKQIPPMYSALHHNGKRLYQLAREGIHVERKARDITIHDFKLIQTNNSGDKQLLTFEINVSKGTYIRTLLEDFAKLCGSYAHMTKLHRTKLGILSDEMLSIDALQQHENPLQLLQPMDKALIEYEKFQLTKDQVQTLIHGLSFNSKLAPATYRLYDHNNKFLGLGQAQQNHEFRVKKLFLKSYQQ
jgi:tRNA pseudouridine55 synthase